MKRKPPSLGPGSPDAPKLEPLIDFLEAQARELVDDWTFDGTTFEQDQHTRLAAMNLFSAAIHLRSLRSSSIVAYRVRASKRGKK